jgi:hypothetical protein
VFCVDSDNDFDRGKRSSKSLQRLLERPRHKRARRKFDGRVLECQQEKENFTGHPEDTFKPEDLEWIKSLRPTGGMTDEVAKSMVTEKSIARE